jgi:uncharacterized protein (TIRG00374 family)
VIRLGWTVGRIVLTVAILASLLRGFDWQAAARALGGFSAASLVAALALIAADRLLMAWRWIMLVRAVAPAPPGELFRIFLVTSFLGSFLPAGLGGDAARAYSVGLQTRRVGPALASVVVDRWLGLLAVGLSGCAGVLLSYSAVPPELRQLTLVATVGLLVGSAAGLHADRLASRLLPGRESGRLASMVHKSAGAVAVYRNHSGVLWSVAALSVVVQAARITLAWVIGGGLGVTLPFSSYWVFMPLNILILLLPLSVGGFGLPQGAMVWTLDPLGVPATEAFLLSLLFVLAGVVGNLPGALLFSAKKGTVPFLRKSEKGDSPLFR